MIRMLLNQSKEKMEGKQRYNGGKTVVK